MAMLEQKSILFHQEHGRLPYIVMDICALNQHELFFNCTSDKEKRIELVTALDEMLEAGGELVLCLHPWRSPILLTRMWCIFEIFRCLALGIKVSAVVSPGDAADIADYVHTGGKLADAVVSLDGQVATASFPADKDIISRTIQKTVGFEEINSMVHNALLREYLEIVTSLKMLRSLDGQIDVRLTGLKTNLHERRGRRQIEEIELRSKLKAVVQNYKKDPEAQQQVTASLIALIEENRLKRCLISSANSGDLKRYLGYKARIVTRMAENCTLWTSASKGAPQGLPGSPISNALKPDTKAYARDLKQLQMFCEELEALAGEVGLWKYGEGGKLTDTSNETTSSKATTSNTHNSRGVFKQLFDKGGS
jgi:hypothetical protein